MSEPIDFYRLAGGQCYTVVKSFNDYYGNDFSAGEKLIFTERHFLPYDGGHTLVFGNRKIYLQEDEQKEIIENFNDYFSVAAAQPETAG